MFFGKCLVVRGLSSVVYICLMIQVTYPQPSFKIKKENNADSIFDAIRKQWLVLTEEEWVRQNFIQYLVQTLKYPAAFIALEKEIQLGELKKRFDVLIYDKDHKPWMMIECKATSVNLERGVLEQILRYNISVPVEYLIITNGHYTHGWKKANNKLESIEELPVW